LSVRRTSSALAATVAALLLAAGAALVAPATGAVEGMLFATVGPGPVIGFQLSSEATVRRIRPGRYYIVVRDRSVLRNFHLRGPGVDRKSPVKAVHAYAWHLRLKKGIYQYYSDPQRSTLHGSFRVG
jgi:hypothetical protein